MAENLNTIIKRTYPGLDTKLVAFLTEVYDLVVELHAWAEALATKLNADTGVADTDYDATISASNPTDPDG